MESGMSQERRHILTTNRVNLMENIANPNEIIEHLYAKHILTDIQKEDVMAERTRHEKIIKILDILPMRGDEAFDMFHQILIGTRNQHAANFLKPKTVDEELPPDWANNQVTEQIKVKNCDTSSLQLRQKWTSSGVYSMTKEIRGRAVIINNKDFSGTTKEECDQLRRNGTEKDGDRLKELFEQLHFEVIVYNNQTKQNINDVLAKEASDQYHETADCFMLTILSHGIKDGILGVDLQVISMETIAGYFTSTSCPNLAGKPKIFFIQACRGENRDNGAVADTALDMTGITKILTDAKTQSSSEHDDIEDGKPSSGKRVAAMRDMFVAYSTTLGFISLRNPLKGSWFIQAVIWVFANYAHNKDLSSLLRMVNQLISQETGTLPKKSGSKSKDVVVQASCYTDSFIKDFYFFPGYFK